MVTTVILAIALRASVVAEGRALMRVLVAGATSVPGLPLLRELNARGHEVVGLTRQSSKTPQIEQAGAKPVVADVFDAAEIDKVVADIEPEVVVCLLTTLPKRGPMRVKDFEPAREAVEHRRVESGGGRAACGRAPDRRGVGDLRLRLSDDRARDRWTSPTRIPARRRRAATRCSRRCAAWSRHVLTSGEHSDTEGIVLRYGIFYGPGRAARPRCSPGW